MVESLDTEADSRSEIRSMLRLLTTGSSVGWSGELNQVVKCLILIHIHLQQAIKVRRNWSSGQESMNSAWERFETQSQSISL